MICQASLAKWHLLLFLFCYCHKIIVTKLCFKKNIIRRACYCQFQNDQINKLVILLVQSSNHFKFILSLAQKLCKIIQACHQDNCPILTSQNLTISFCNNNILLSVLVFCVLESMTVPRLHMGKSGTLPFDLISL